ncbi:MAG: hypothetical protein ACXVZJ_02320 [Terriglobales bacterium]
MDQRIIGFGLAGGLLLFVAATGIVLWLPFSLFTQTTLLFHVFFGVMGSGLFGVWQLRHWLDGRRVPRTARKVSAYVGFWLLAASVVSGLVESWQALFGRYVSSYWDWLHMWTSILALLFLAYHLWPVHKKQPEDANIHLSELRACRRRNWVRAAATIVVLFVACGALSTYYAHQQTADRLRQHVGPDHDFRPSMVDTEQGRPIPVEVLANSDSCGTSDCHAGIYREWKPSAHRWSAEDDFFQEVRQVTTRVKGQRETEKCGACHDPVSMLSGHKDPKLGRDAPGHGEGDSCVVCHAVRTVDERGIGSYVLAAPTPYLYESATTSYGRRVNHFLIRSYPAQHNRDFDLTLPRKPESCAPCHKEYDVLDEKEGPVQVETQFDDWKQGKWNTNVDRSQRLYCQQCHMHLVATDDAGADPYNLKAHRGARHHNHAFSAANQYMPMALSAPNAAAHVERVHEWLRGERVVPEIEKAWPRGSIVDLKMTAPESVRPGDTLHLQVTLSNRKVGHSFPTGPLNIARAWIEVVAEEDATGRRLFHSGLLDSENHIEAGSYILKPLAIDASGHMIMKPDLWHPDGPKFRRAILAGESDTYDYAFIVPPGTHGALSIKARLRYSKANQFFMDAVYPEQRRQPPITDLSSAQLRLELKK